MTGAAGIGAEDGADLPTQQLRAAQPQGRHADLAVTWSAIPALTLCVNTRMTPSNIARTALMLTF